MSGASSSAVTSTAAAATTVVAPNFWERTVDSAKKFAAHPKIQKIWDKVIAQMQDALPYIVLGVTAYVTIRRPVHVLVGAFLASWLLGQRVRIGEDIDVQLQEFINDKRKCSYAIITLLAVHIILDVSSTALGMGILATLYAINLKNEYDARQVAAEAEAKNKVAVSAT